MGRKRGYLRTWSAYHQTIITMGVQYTGRRMTHCVGCGFLAFANPCEEEAGMLCDWVVGKKTKTCDAPLCWECAIVGAVGLFENKAGKRDVTTYCPRHFNLYLELDK